ncbi:MAG: glycosyltransferase family 9 protein [Janthinobacterium lividum]
MQTAPFANARRIAVFASPMVGDALLMQTIVRSLVADGREVVVYGNVASQLRRWLSGVDIRPAFNIAEESSVARYDVIVQLHPDRPINAPELLTVPVLSIYGTTDPWPSAVLDQFAHFCRKFFGLEHFAGASDLTAPPALQWRHHASRIVIHPTSSESHKCWRPQRFVRLAEVLRERGFQPKFIVSQSERPDWIWLEQRGFEVLESNTLDDAATWLYESGWFIGNDSGIGHLASALGIPTLSLFSRKSRAARWRPAWAPGLFVHPQFLPLRFLRNNYWQYAISVQRVAREFEKLCITFGEQRPSAVL